MIEIYRNGVLFNGDYFDFDSFVDFKILKKVEFINEKLIYSNGLFVNTICFHDLLLNYEFKRNVFFELKSRKVKLRYIGFSTIFLFQIFKSDNIVIVKDYYYFLNKILHSMIFPISVFKIFLYSILSITYIFFKSIKCSTKSIFFGKNLVLIHSKTALNKCIKFCDFRNETATILFDSFNVKIENKYNKYNLIDFYSILSTFQFFKAIPLLLINVFKEAKLIHDEFKFIFSKSSRFYLISIYSNRFFHCVFYAYILNFFVKKNIGKINTIISGEKESRFAIIENNIINKFKIDGICIPHGLEYNFKYPKPLFGNLFYTTSENAKKSLEVMYSNINFIYDKFIVKTLYKEYGNNYKNKKVVFFTDSRNVKLDHFIIRNLATQFDDIFVKVHPNDFEHNYFDINNIYFINNFNDAVCNNIVLSRNSTVLLEGIYNNSTCISIILNKKDKFISNYLYPSLNNSEILKVEKLEDLKITLFKLKNI